jgi:hypothetical protein
MERHKQLEHQHHNAYKNLELKYERIVEEKQKAQHEAEEKLKAFKKREVERKEKELLQEQKRYIENKHKETELIAAQNQCRVPNNNFCINARTYINTELLKICANDVRRTTDAGGLEWYSVIDFMMVVCTDKTKKQVYKTWEFFKTQSKSKGEIESFTRRVNFTDGHITDPSESDSRHDNKTPAAILSGLHEMLRIMTTKHVGRGYHSLVNAALSIAPM